MIRRHRRVLPATIVAVLLLAGVVLLVVSCVQLLLGQPPLVPFATLAAGGAGLPWASGAVIAAGLVLAVLGLVLLGCAWTRGAATVVPLAATEHSTAGVTRHSLRRLVTDTARSADGVHAASVTVTPSRVRAAVTTPLHEPGDLRTQVTTAINEQLGALTLHRTPRTRVRVTTARST